MFGADTGSRVQGQFHFADFLIDVFHELYDKVDELVLEHGLRVKIGDEKADVVAFDRFSTQNDEILGAHHHKTHELVTKYLLDFVRLLNADADAKRVDGALDENALLFVSAHDDRREENLLIRSYFHLRLVVTLDDLRREVFEAHRRFETRSNRVQVRSQRRRHPLSQWSQSIYGPL